MGKGVPLRPITLYPLTPNFGRYAPVFSLNDYSEVVNVIFCRQEDVRDGKPQTWTLRYILLYSQNVIACCYGSIFIVISRSRYVSSFEVIHWTRNTVCPTVRISTIPRNDSCCCHDICLATARISGWVSVHHNKAERNFKSLYNHKIPNATPNPNPNPNLEQKVGLTAVLRYIFLSIYLVTDSCSAEWQCFSCAGTNWLTNYLLTYLLTYVTKTVLPLFCWFNSDGLLHFDFNLLTCRMPYLANRDFIIFII